MPTDDQPLVVVLGASGFLGSRLVAAFACREVRLRAVARRAVTVPPTARALVDVRTADLVKPGAVAAAIAGADVVLHLVNHSAGWRSAARCSSAERVNVGVVRDVVGTLSAARGPAPVLVLAGSTSQTGAVRRLPVDGTEPDRPDTPYDRQKLAAEQLVETADVIRGVVLRLPTVYGQHPPPSAPDRGVVSAMARRALAGQPLTMWHDGTVLRDLLHVNDVVTAFEAAVAHADALTGRHWPLGTGRGVALGDVFAAVTEAVSTHTGSPAVPVIQITPPAEATPGDLRDMVVDASRFHGVTGWTPRVELRDGLASTVAALLEAPVKR